MNISQEFLEEKYQELWQAMNEAPPCERSLLLRKLDKLVALQREFESYCKRLNSVLYEEKQYVDIRITQGSLKNNNLSLRPAVKAGFTTFNTPITISIPGTQLEPITSILKSNGFLQNRAIVRAIYEGWKVRAGDILRLTMVAHNEFTLQRVSKEDDALPALSIDYPLGRRSPFRFSLFNIPIGERIEYCFDPSLEIVVCDDRHVVFQGKKYALTPLFQKLYGTSSFARAIKYFSYHGKTLLDLVEQQYDAE